MPAIRVERTAVKPFFLGHLGFDHLQLVYDPDDDGGSQQDDWLVIEGVRDPGPLGATLGVQGGDGRLTLSRANTASGEALALKLGTPASRGSRVISRGREAERLWPLLAGHADAIDRLHLAYVAYALPGTRQPTCNSSSVIATLLDRFGFDVAASMPVGTRFVPGIETRIGQRHPARSIARTRLGWHRSTGYAKNQTSEYGSIWPNHVGHPQCDSGGGGIRSLVGCR